MKKKTIKNDRAFHISVYNALKSGESYPDLATRLDIPVIKAFKTFSAIEKDVENSPKLRLECLAYRCAKSPLLADKAIYNLKLRGITDINDFAEVAKADIGKVMEAVKSWDGVGEKIATVIFKMLKEMKGGNA